MAANTQDALAGGFNASVNLDSHGKSWSYLNLGLVLDDTERGLPASDPEWSPSAFPPSAGQAANTSRMRERMFFCCSAEVSLPSLVS
jgi:hypothetical protein